MKSKLNTYEMLKARDIAIFLKNKARRPVNKWGIHFSSLLAVLVLFMFLVSPEMKDEAVIPTVLVIAISITFVNWVLYTLNIVFSGPAIHRMNLPANVWGMVDEERHEIIYKKAVEIAKGGKE